MLEVGLTRYSEPGEMDQAPRGTLCKKIRSLSDDYELWIQTCNREEKPYWVLIGSYTKETPKSLIEEDIKATL